MSVQLSSLQGSFLLAEVGVAHLEGPSEQGASGHSSADVLGDTCYPVSCQGLGLTQDSGWVLGASLASGLTHL